MFRTLRVGICIKLGDYELPAHFYDRQFVVTSFCSYINLYIIFVYKRSEFMCRNSLLESQISNSIDLVLDMPYGLMLHILYIFAVWVVYYIDPFL